MIPKECKRLAEVDFPIAVVSRHSAREKSIRHGHPSTLHLWWARRPLAACRSMLLALLLPDPCDEYCPAEFKKEARALLPSVQGEPGPKDIELQKALLRFIGDFSNWDLAANQRYVEVGRGLVKAAHGEEAPLVVDPFAGGGSIPLEALRLGCDAFASDLNPVACLILKTMLEDIPRHGQALADELRRVGAEVKKQAEKELAQYYPPEPDGAAPIAYLWARTVRCESPNCGAEIPLVRSFWLCKKGSKLRALRYQVRRPKDEPPCIEFQVFAPKSEKEVPPGTVTRARATCFACGRVLAPDRVRAQLRQQRGGAKVEFDARGKRIGGAWLLAVVTVTDNAAGRQYRTGINSDYEPVRKAAAMAKIVESKLPNGLGPIPDEPLGRVPVSFGVINVWFYGIENWGELFSPRQQLAISTVGKLILGSASHKCSNLLAMTLGKIEDFNSSLARWAPSRETSAATFGRPALGMLWDYCETVPTSTSTGSLGGALEYAANVSNLISQFGAKSAHVQQADARELTLPHNSADVWFTDPPYYDAVPYSYISDFFYVWLRRYAPGPLGDAFREPLAPKAHEIVAYLREDQDREGAKKRFEEALGAAFVESRRILKDDGIGSIVFAHKTTEGWEALLTGIIRGGWVITGSWPVATERLSRPRSQESAALAGSVHLICRPRKEDALVGDWGDVLRELPNRIGDWMERLSSEGVRGADLVFACIGPAMEIYSRYSGVEDAEGRPIPLGGDPEATEPYRRGFLAHVWEIVGRTALGQVLGTAEARARNGAAGALEEDARLTALFLWTHQSTTSNSASGGPHPDPLPEGEGEEEGDEDEEAPGGGSNKGLTLIFDVVRRFSQPLGIHLDTWNDRIIETKKGIVRLLPVKERAEHLLGEDGASGVADVIERSRGGPINYQFGFMDGEKRAPKPGTDGRKRGKSATPDQAPTVAPGTTTLDRVHIAMLLQASGKANALRTMLKSEVERGPDFLRLANALSALYPKDSEEKRLLDAMLLAVPR